MFGCANDSSFSIPTSMSITHLSAVGRRISRADSALSGSSRTMNCGGRQGGRLDSCSLPTSVTSAGKLSALRRQYAGCHVGTTLSMADPARAPVGFLAGPTRRFVMFLGSSTSAEAAVPPSAKTLVAPDSRSSARRRSLQLLTAARGGVALPGGLQRQTLVSITSLGLYL